jgi:hypothetical protein
VGQGGKFSAEREPLRASLRVPADSPLRKVTMRNNFEHFDERLDAWWEKSAQHNHVDMIVGPGSLVSGFADVEMFRQLDTRSGDLTFWGQRFNLPDIIAEIDRVRLIAETEAAKPNWVE